MLRPDAGNNRTVDVEATSVHEALDRLIAVYPGLAGRVLKDDSLPTFLNVFVDGQDVRLSGGLATEVHAGSTILLLPAVAGGC